MPTIPTGVSHLLITACIKAVWDQTVLIHPLKHYVDSSVLQEVVYCSYNGKKKAINKGRQTIITIKVSF